MKIHLISAPYLEGNRFIVPYGMATAFSYLQQRHDIRQTDLMVDINRLNKSRKHIKKKFDLSDFSDFRVFESFLMNDRVSRPIQTLKHMLRLIRLNENEVIAFSVHCSSQLFFALSLSKLIKKSTDCKIIFGGAFFHNSDYKHIYSTFPFVDVIVKGAIDLAIDDIENTLNADKRALVVKGYSKKYFQPDYSGLDIRMYSKIIDGRNELMLPVMTSIGCSNSCCFCYFCKELVQYEVDEIINSISRLKKVYRNNYFYFVNLNLNMNQFPVKKFLKKLIDSNLDIKWHSRCMVDKLDDETIQLMGDSGCKELEIGLETGSERLLSLMNKAQNLKSFRNKIRKLHNLGVKIDLNIIAGLPFENRQDHLKTLIFLKRNSRYINHLNIRPFQAMYGSHIFNNPQKYGIRIKKPKSSLRSVWGNYDFEYERPVNVSKRIEDLKEIYFTDILRKQYSILNIIPYQAFDFLYFRRKMFTNPLINFLFIKSIGKKQILWRN